MSLTRHTNRRTISHLLLSGYNPLSPPSNSATLSRQSPSNPSLSPVPLSTWLSQLGREVDTYSGPNLVTSISSSTGHSLLCYRNYQAIDRVIGLGRNESGQLGIGFASQEGTRGLVEGFKGESVLAVKTAVQASYLLVKHDDQTNRLYSIGNLSRGRLGHPNLYSRTTSDSPRQEEEDEGSEPITKILPRATLVEPVPEEESGQIVQIETGYEHLLVLTSNGHVYGTGCNTDGQLATTPPSDLYSLTRIEIPPEIESHEGGIEKIVAGGDTSGLITKSGKLYTWGNSEYHQAGHGRKIDQVLRPLRVETETFLRDPERRIVDYQCGGSFGVILDDRHNVYTVGYGAVAQSSSSPLFNPIPTLVPSLSSSNLSSSPITRIKAAFGYAVAISDSTTPSSEEEGGPKLWSWGINNRFGRLGLGTTSSSSPQKGDQVNRALRVEDHVKEPRRVELPLRELGLLSGEGSGEKRDWEIGKVELGDEGMWVELRQEVVQEEGLVGQEVEDRRVGVYRRD